MHNVKSKLTLQFRKHPLCEPERDISVASYGALGHVHVLGHSTSSCLIFGVTSELHKLTFDSMWLHIQ